MNTCVVLNGYQDRAVWIYRYKSSVNGNKHNSVLWQIVTQVMKFVTVHNKCSKNPTVDLTVLGNPCEKMAPCLSCVELYVSLCWQQRPKSERAIRLVSTCLLLTSFFISRSGKKNLNGFRCGDWNSSISVTIDIWTHVDMNFLPRGYWYCRVPKYLLFLPESPYVLTIVWLCW